MRQCAVGAGSKSDGWDKEQRLRSYITTNLSAGAVELLCLWFGIVSWAAETGPVVCQGKAGIWNTLGPALFQMDYALRAAVAGFDRFFWHDGLGCCYCSVWEPLGTEEHPWEVSLSDVSSLEHGLRYVY